jgi:transposase
MRIAPKIDLTHKEQSTLTGWVNAHSCEKRLSFPAKIILAAAEGTQNKDIARQLGTREATISKWRRRFASERLEGLQDAPRSGAPPAYDEHTDKRILGALDEAPPAGFSHWDGTLLSEHLGDISSQYIWRMLRSHGIHLQRNHSWCVSTDPQFEAKAADIVGLYLDPPDNAVVLCIDEKPAIQALERAQGWLRLPNGKAISGYNHEYNRHGTTTLFAGLEVATGQITTGHFSRHRRREFLSFMNDVVGGYPADQQLHVILDNYSTHKPKHDRWLARHKNVHFHYTPTHASWMNQVEVWFSILTRKSLKQSSFTSTRQVRQTIDKFTEAYNKQASPFEWKKTNVHPGKIKYNYADL